MACLCPIFTHQAWPHRRLCLTLVIVFVFIFRVFAGGFSLRLFDFDFGLVGQAVSSFRHHHFPRLETGDNLHLLAGRNAGLYITAAGLVL